MFSDGSFVVRGRLLFYKEAFSVGAGTIREQINVDLFFFDHPL